MFLLICIVDFRATYPNNFLLWIQRCSHDRVDWGGVAKTNHMTY